MKDHEEPLHELDFVPFYEDIQVEFEEGTTREVEMFDGSRLLLKKLGRDYDPTDKMNAIAALHEAEQSQEVLTGILYVDRTRENFLELLEMSEHPLALMPEDKVRPSRETLTEIMDEFR